MPHLQPRGRCTKADCQVSCGGYYAVNSNGDLVGVSWKSSLNAGGHVLMLYVRFFQYPQTADEHCEVCKHPYGAHEVNGADVANQTPLRGQRKIGIAGGVCGGFLHDHSVSSFHPHIMNLLTALCSDSHSAYLHFSLCMLLEALGSS